MAGFEGQVATYQRRILELIRDLPYADKVRVLDAILHLSTGDTDIVETFRNAVDTNTYDTYCSGWIKLEDKVKRDSNWLEIQKSLNLYLKKLLLGTKLRHGANIRFPQQTQQSNGDVAMSEPTPSSNTRVFNGIYFMLLLLAIGVTVYIATQTSVEKVEVTVTYDVGAILGSILAGGGIAAAGAAYASRTLAPPPSDRIG